MQQASPPGQSGAPAQQKKIEEERKKLEADLKAGKITQAQYYKRMQELTGSMPNPNAPGPGITPPQPGVVNPPIPQLPPAGQAPIKPISPVTPVTPQVGPHEEVPPIGQALAISSEDVEVVECYKCGGLITVTAQQRPVIIACPSCGTKGEVDASEVELAPEQPSVPKPTEATELDKDKIFKFSGESPVEMPKGPTFGATLDEDLARQEAAKKPAPTQPAKPSTPAPTPTMQPSAEQTQASVKVKKPA